MSQKTLSSVTAAAVAVAASDRRGEQPVRPRWWTRLAVGLAAGAVASVTLGLTARLLMRLAALAAGVPTHLTWQGTVVIINAFAAFLVPGALLAALWLGRGRSILLVLGGLAFCLPVIGVATMDLETVGDLTASQWAGVLAAAGGILVCALAIPVVTLGLIRLGLRVTTRA